MSTAACVQAENLATGCSYPYISSNTTDSNGERAFCGETYAERISPWHITQCLIHSALSVILFLVLTLWAINAYADYVESMPRKRGLEYRYKMHSFGALAALFNLLASVDLKGYAARFPLLAVEIFNELAISALMCLLFHMVNQWVDVITLGGRQKWGKFQKAVLPYMCLLITCIRLSFGVMQWLAVPNGLRDGSFNGNLNSIKLFASFLVMGTYTSIGLHASVYEPMKSKKAEVKRATIRRLSMNLGPAPRADTQISVIQPRGSAKAAVKAGKKKIILRTRYFVGLFAIMCFYVGYLGWVVVYRVGKIEQRGVPCTPFTKGVYINQGAYILILAVYVYLSSNSECNSSLNGGCTWPHSLAERRRRRVLRSIFRQQQKSAAATAARKSATREKQSKINQEVIDALETFDEDEKAAQAHLRENWDTINNIDIMEENEDTFMISPIQFARRFTNIVTGGVSLVDDDTAETQDSTTFSTTALFSVLDFNSSRDRNMSGANEKGLRNGELPTVNELFDLLDTDGNGALSLEEVVSNHELLSMTRTEASILFKSLDPLRKGSINRKEFEDSLGLLGDVSNWAGELLGFGERPKLTEINRKQAEEAQQDSRERMMFERDPSVIAFSGFSGVRLGSTI